MEEYNEDFFYYINAVQDPLTKRSPDLSELEKEVKRPDHKIILCMGSFAYKSVIQKIHLEAEVKKNYSIRDLGEYFLS